MTENAREGLMKEVLHADDLVLMSETMVGLKKKFLKWRYGLDSMGLKVNLEKAKVVVYGSKDEVIRSKTDRGKRVTVNSLL